MQSLENSASTETKTHKKFGICKVPFMQGWYKVKFDNPLPEYVNKAWSNDNTALVHDSELVK